MNSTISVPKRLRGVAVQVVFADAVPGDLEKIEEAVTEAAQVGAVAVLFP